MPMSNVEVNNQYMLIAYISLRQLSMFMWRHTDG